MLLSFLQKSDGNFNVPVLEIGIAGHWIHQDKNRTPKYEQFVKSFPSYASVNDWVATYESWLF